MRYIIITGMNAANEALQKLITSDVIGAGFDQPGLTVLPGALFFRFPSDP